MGSYFDDVTLTLTVEGGAAVDVSCDVTAATLVPETPEEIRKRLCGPTTLVGTTTWGLELEYDQNWAAGSAGPPVVSQGISSFLAAHAGELADFTIEWPAEGETATGKVRLKAGPYGGTAGEVAEASVTLGLDGVPTFATYVPAASRSADTEISTSVDTDDEEEAA